MSNNLLLKALEDALGIKLESIERYDISSLTAIFPQNIYIINKQNHITGLYLGGVKLTNRESLLFVFNHLTHLNLSNTDIMDTSFLKMLTELTFLNISGNAKIKDYSFLKKLNKLTSLNISYNPIHDASFLKELTGLRSLHLGHNNPRVLKPLSSLSFQNKKIGDNFTTKIVDYSCLKNLTGLTSLQIVSNEISDASFLKKLSGLQSLDISNNNISDVSFLTYMPLLQYVNLDDNPITTPPPEIVKQGLAAIKSYFYSHKTQKPDLTKSLPWSRLFPAVDQELSRLKTPPQKNTGTRPVFISYAHTNRDKADVIERIIENAGYTIKRDIKEIKYKDDIVDFMKSIRDCAYVIAIVSDDFLKSRDCMFEMIQLMKDNDFKAKIMPVRLSNADIFDALGKVAYIKYWKQKCEELEDALNELGAAEGTGIRKDLAIIQQITQEIDELMTDLSRMLLYSYETLQKNGFADLIKKMG